MACWGERRVGKCCTSKPPTCPHFLSLSFSLSLFLYPLSHAHFLCFLISFLPSSFPSPSLALSRSLSLTISLSLSLSLSQSLSLLLSLSLSLSHTQIGRAS